MPLSVRRHTRCRGLAVSTGSERAGLPAAPFGKTPAAEALTEYDLPPAEFFNLLFYRLHKGSVELENVIADINQMSAFRSKPTVRLDCILSEKTVMSSLS